MVHCTNVALISVQRTIDSFAWAAPRHRLNSGGAASCRGWRSGKPEQPQTSRLSLESPLQPVGSEVRSKTRGGLISAQYWGHDEYDANGRLVARYEGFKEWNSQTGARSSGWRKYDELGRLLDAAESLFPRA